VRLQALLEPTERLPEAMRMTTVAATVAANDAVALAGWDLSGLEGRTLVFDLGYDLGYDDLGYYSHRNLGRLREGGVHFLTRLKGQARYRLSASRVSAAEGERRGGGAQDARGRHGRLRGETISLGTAPTTDAGRSSRGCAW
jgi:hypothetical protein